MCLGDSPNPGTFSNLPGVKSVLPREFLLLFPKIFGGPPGVLQSGVLYLSSDNILFAFLSEEMAILTVHFSFERGNLIYCVATIQNK